MNIGKNHPNSPDFDSGLADAVHDLAIDIEKEITEDNEDLLQVFLESFSDTLIIDLLKAKRYEDFGVACGNMLAQAVKLESVARAEAKIELDISNAESDHADYRIAASELDTP